MPNSPAMGGGMGGGPGMGGMMGGGGPGMGGGMMGGGMGMQGGMPQGAPQGMQQNFQEGGQAVAGIAKNMSWKLLFFLGACCTLGASIISILDIVFTLEWAPVSFISVLFMLFFGSLMVVLDFPIPHPSPSLAAVRASIYKFFLFLTRFTGRGIWYLFLGTMIFASLYDQDISAFFGICLGGYVGILGLVTLVFGIRLSQKLDMVRQELLMGPKECPHNGYSMEGFRTLAMQVAKQDFSDDELVYIFNGLSFSPMNDGVIIPEEYKQWLMPGKMEII